MSVAGSSHSTHCTPKKTFEIANARGIHLIVQLKGNQKSLHHQVRANTPAVAPLSEDKTTVSGKRNRHETRSVAVFEAEEIIINKKWRGMVCAVIRVERTVHRLQTKTGLWKTSRETSYYLSNRPVTAQDANTAIQNHWSVENSNHHVRDVTFREDDSRIRNNPGIFSIFRSFAANILRFNQRKSIRQDRFACACGGLQYLTKLKFK